MQSSRKSTLVRVIWFAYSRAYVCSFEIIIFVLLVCKQNIVVDKHSQRNSLSTSQVQRKVLLGDTTLMPLTLFRKAQTKQRRHMLPDTGLTTFERVCLLTFEIKVILLTSNSVDSILKVSNKPQQFLYLYISTVSNFIPL